MWKLIRISQERNYKEVRGDISPQEPFVYDILINV